MSKKDIVLDVVELIAGLIALVLMGMLFVAVVGSLVEMVFNWGPGEITLSGSIGAVLKWWAYGMGVTIILLIFTGSSLGDLEPKGSCGGSIIAGGFVGLILYICDAIWELPL